MAKFYSNTSKIMHLTAGIGIPDTTIVVDDATGLPASFPYNLVIDPDTSSIEIVSVTAATINTLTVVRGREDTTAKVHSTNAIVWHVWTAQDGTDAQNHYAAASAVHGLAGTVVGTTDAQTLTNKTMSGSNNTFSNIPGSAIANNPVLHNTISDNAASAVAAALIAQNSQPSTTPALIAQWQAGGTGLQVATYAGAVASGKQIECFNGAVSKFAVDYDGNTTIAGTATITGATTVSGGTSSLRDVTANQRQAGQPALALTASAGSPTASLARFIPDDGVPALDLKRNSTSNPTQAIFRVLSQADGELFRINRDGTITGLTDAWQTYTPTFTSSGTAPSLGNGSTSGRYLKCGHLAVAVGALVVGSTTTFGTGDLRFGLPATTVNSGLEQIGGAVLLDSGTTRYSASALAPSNTAYIQIVATSTNFIQATIPFTWTTNDTIQFMIVVETA